ncbi:MAG TPA: hypothetical protein PKV75_08570, partial [Desulfobacterales bacterium]|nr:hypothetical protein [Desulfobacterales bacterium]
MQSTMKPFLTIMMVLLVAAFFTTPALAGHGAKSASHAAVIEGGDTINISGIVSDSHGEPVNEARVLISVNGKELDEQHTAHSGKYVSTFMMEKDQVQTAKIHIEGRKAS